MNILVTNFDNSYEDVMIFTEKEHITPEWVSNKLTKQNKPFTEVYEVQDNELSSYLYEPCYM